MPLSQVQLSHGATRHNAEGARKTNNKKQALHVPIAVVVCRKGTCVSRKLCKQVFCRHNKTTPEEGSYLVPLLTRICVCCFATSPVSAMHGYPLNVETDQKVSLSTYFIWSIAVVVSISPTFPTWQGSFQSPSRAEWPQSVGSGPSAQRGGVSFRAVLPSTTDRLGCPDLPFCTHLNRKRHTVYFEGQHPIVRFRVRPSHLPTCPQGGCERGAAFVFLGRTSSCLLFEVEATCEHLVNAPDAE